MSAFTKNQPLKKYLDILIANLIKRHLYVKDMAEGNWYLGQIAGFRKLQNDADRWDGLLLKNREEKT